MTSPSKLQARDIDADYIRGEIGRLSNDLVEVSSKTDMTRKEVSGLKGELGQLRENVASLEEEDSLDSCPESEHPLAIRPVPQDPSHPTDEEIRMHVLYELYRKNSWNGKHTSQENLRRGYLARTEHRRVWEAINHLRAQGLILAHGKSAEEHYSLNPELASEVYRELGIPPRTRNTRVTLNQTFGKGGVAPMDQARKETETYVRLGHFKNTVAGLKESLDSANRGVSQLGQEIARLKKAETELADELSARTDAIEQRLHAIETHLFSRVTSAPISSKDETWEPPNGSEGQQ